MAMFLVFVSAFSDYKGAGVVQCVLLFSPTHQRTVRYGISNFIPLLFVSFAQIYCLEGVVQGNRMGFWWLEIQIYKVCPDAGCGFDSRCLAVWSFHVLLVSVWVGSAGSPASSCESEVMHASLVHLLACGCCIFSPLDGDHTSRRSYS